jgi:hypothetical protein
MGTCDSVNNFNPKFIEAMTGRRPRRYSRDPDWHDEIVKMIGVFRTRAILRGGLERRAVSDWIGSIEDEILREEAMNAIGRRGYLSRIGLIPLKGGLLVPHSGELSSLWIVYLCRGSLQYCLETAVCVYEGYEVYPEFDSVHIAKGHTGALKGICLGRVEGHTLRKESLLESKSSEYGNLMSRASIIAHFFAKRSLYEEEDILHLLVRWWRRGFYEPVDLEQAAARFGVSTIMSPYIRMLSFVPRKSVPEVWVL